MFGVGQQRANGSELRPSGMDAVPDAVCGLARAEQATLGARAMCVVCGA